MKGSQYGGSSSIFGSFRRICYCRNRRDHHDDQIGRDQANPNPRYFVGTDFKNLAGSVRPPLKRKYCLMRLVFHFRVILFEPACQCQLVIGAFAA